MCFSDDARPPLPPISGAAANETELELTASDGNRFAAHAARSERRSGAGVVILPDVRGLHTFYRELAARFADAGFDAVAFDYFGRTAGIGERDESFDHKPHVEKTTPEGIAADVAACIAYLRSADGGGVRAVFTLGFCFGGGQSWRQAADQRDLSGAIGLYGNPAILEEFAGRFHSPLLVLVAGNDFRPVEAFEKGAAAARDAGTEVELHAYPGAPHSFFDRKFDEFAKESQDAWMRMLDFISRNSRVAATT